MPSIQENIKERIIKELKGKLNTELGIGKLHIQPFNTVELNDIYLYDQQNEQILHAQKLYASISLFALINKEIIVTSVRLNNFEINLTKETSDSPLNIQFVLDALKSNDEQQKTAFDLKVNSININNGNVSFDVKDKIETENKFDPNHIQVSNFNARLALKSLKSDSLNIQIKELSLKEKSSFEIKNLVVRLITQNKTINLKGFKLETPKSLLQLGKCEVDLSKVTDSQNLADSAIIQCSIISSHITPKDISPFSDIFKNFNDRIYLKSEISGSINNFNVSNLSLDYGDRMQLIANAEVVDILYKDRTYISGKVDNLQITPDGIKGLINNFSTTPENIPNQIINLGTITFTGDISGYTKNLRAHGLLTSKLGNVKANLLFGFNTHANLESFFKGSISTNKFQIGNLLENKDLDLLSFDLSIDLQKQPHKKMGGEVKGLISHLDYKNYPYQNITLNGKYNGLKMEGKLAIDDENIFLNIDGLADFSQKQPVFDFIAKLRNLKIEELNLSDKYDNSYLSLNANAKFTGKNIDNAIGYLNIDSIRFYKDGDRLFIDKFMVEASGENSDKKLKIRSDIINGEVTGEYSFTTIINSFKQTIHPYLPSLVSLNKKDSNKIKGNNLSLDFTVGNTEQISKILSLPFVVFSEAKIIGFYNNVYEKFRLEIFYPSGKVGGMNLKSGYLLAENSGKKIKTDFTALIQGKNNVMNDVSVSILANNDTLDTKIELVNNSKQKFNVSLAAISSFSREEKDNTLNTEIDILPKSIVINDTLWQISRSKIRIDSQLLSVNDFRIANNTGSQSIDIEGKYSQHNPDEKLTVDLKKIDLEYVFNTLAIEALNFGGFATGSLQLANIGGTPYPYANLEVDNFKFNNTELGHLTLHSELSGNEKKNISLNGILVDDEKRQTKIDGFINPAEQELSINFDATKVNIAFLNKYASSLFNNISGKGSGKVHLFGNFSDVTVEGKAFIENGSLGINFLNTNYTFTDTVYLKKDLIYFNNITFYDQYKNTANISGKVVHDYFSDFMYYVELMGDKFMLYNATEKQNSMFYGKVFGSGFGSISGDEQAVDIEARLRTDNNTNICMNFMEESIGSYSFITFKDKDSTQVSTDSIRTNVQQISDKAIKTESGMDINMNFYIDATPDATVEIVMDPVGGDKLKCSGTGALQFVWGTKTAPQLYGTYTITRGNYNFTFQKILERRFVIESGSNVLFRGDPFQANLGVKAIYRLNANLKDLDQDLVRNTGQTNIPVECILKIAGELRHPNIELDIALPSADAEVQRQVKSLMNNEDMINRQVVYLLLLSKFYTPEYFNVGNKTNDFASVASATLSTQLTKMLSMIDDRWQFGTNIRTSDSNFTDTEIELLLSSQILNDRVLLNGNLGYRNFSNYDPNNPNQQMQESIIGEIDIEVLLNKIGTWRLKAYNHYNEKYYIHGGNGPLQTQGIGIMYKRDFDSLKEVFKSTRKPAKKDTIRPLLPDSTMKGSPLGDFIKIKE